MQAGPAVSGKAVALGGLMQTAELNGGAIHHEQTYSRNQKAISGAAKVIAPQPGTASMDRRNNADGTVPDRSATGKSDFESRDDLIPANDSASREHGGEWHLISSEQS